MKKIVLISTVILVVIAASIGLAACNNATPQGQLANLLNPHQHEIFDYTLSSDYQGVSGTLHVTLDAYKKGDAIAEFGSASITPDYDGVLVKSVLNAAIDGKTYKYEYGCFYRLTTSSTAYMVPQNCFRRTYEGERETFDMQGTYVGSEFKYTRSINGGATQKGELKVGSGAKLDNNEFQQLLRSVTTYANGLSMSFTTPVVSASEVSTVTLNANCNTVRNITGSPFCDAYEVTDSEGKVTTPYKEEGIPCYMVKVSRSTQVAGSSETLFYAVDNLKLSGWSVKNVLVKFEEPFKRGDKQCTMTYTLSDAAIA